MWFLLHGRGPSVSTGLLTPVTYYVLYADPLGVLFQCCADVVLEMRNFLKLLSAYTSWWKGCNHLKVTIQWDATVSNFITIIVDRNVLVLLTVVKQYHFQRQLNTHGKSYSIQVFNGYSTLRSGDVNCIWIVHMLTHIPLTTIGEISVFSPKTMLLYDGHYIMWIGLFL